MVIAKSGAYATAQMNDLYAGGSNIANPAAEQVLADTGALSAGRYYFSFFMDASVAATYRMAHRNAADSANLDPTKEIPIPATTEIDIMFGDYITMAEGEKMKVINVNVLTGTARALIKFSRVL